MALTDGVTGQTLTGALEPLLADPQRRAAMAERARAHGRPDAVERLVDVILSAVSG